MEAAYSAAMRGMQAVRASMDNAYKSINDYIQAHDENAKQHLADASVKATEAIDKYSAKFEKDYSSAMEAVNKAWKDMKDKLEQGYKPEEIK